MKIFKECLECQIMPFGFSYYNHPKYGKIKGFKMSLLLTKKKYSYQYMEKVPFFLYLTYIQKFGWDLRWIEK